MHIFRIWFYFSVANKRKVFCGLVPVPPNPRFCFQVVVSLSIQLKDFPVHQVLTRAGTLLWYTFVKCYVYFWSFKKINNTTMLHLTYLKIFFPQEQQAGTL